MAFEDVLREAFAPAGGNWTTKREVARHASMARRVAWSRVTRIDDRLLSHVGERLIDESEHRSGPKATATGQSREWCHRPQAQWAGAIRSAR